MTAHVIQAFDKAGYTPLVDGVHGKQHAWLWSQFGDKPHLAFTMDSDCILTSYKLNEHHERYPSFVWFYNADNVIYETDWMFIKKYVNSLFYGDLMHPISERAMMLLDHTLVVKAVDQETAVADLEDDMMDVDDRQDEYHWRKYIVEERDVGLLEIRKPHTDTPYTVVVREFSKRGCLPLFTSLYICDSWGVSRFDAVFLEKLWFFLEMEGEFDLELMLREATERCLPREGHVPEAEPEVYRRSIEDVLKEFDKRECGH